MKILILGGTQFVGRAIAEAALEAGHEVTLFHRGKTNANILPQAEHILGDRDGQIDRLSGGKWDWVIDVCGYFPRVVKLSLDALKGVADRYLFVSTISVYKDEGILNTDENAPLLPTDNIEGEEITRETYGPLKVLCEEAVNEVYGDKALIIRPGFIIGPHDPTDRMTYWVRRIACEKTVLCPATGDQPMQCIDTRDLGRWMIELAGKNASGTYHATGPENKILFADILRLIQSATESNCELRWTEPKRLQEAGVRLFTELPFTITPDFATHQLVSVSLRKALNAGLRLRPLESSMRDILEWDRARGFPALSIRMTREREEALLASLSDSR